jgi:hypothetical protein
VLAVPETVIVETPVGVGVEVGVRVAVRVGVEVGLEVTEGVWLTEGVGLPPLLQLEELKSQKLVMFKAMPVVVVVIWVPNDRSGLAGQPDWP